MKVLARLAQLVLFVSFGCLVWSLWPAALASKTWTIPIVFPEDSQQSQSEYLTVTLEWPKIIRCGDVGVISMNVAPGGPTTSDTRYMAGQNFPGSQVILDLSRSRNILAETRLDFVNLEIEPSTDVSQPLLPGKKALFWWNIKTDTVGRMEGTLWLHLRSIPQDRTQEVHRPLLAYPIEFDAVRLAGLSGVSARWLGILGIIFGAVLWIAAYPNWFGRNHER